MYNRTLQRPMFRIGGSAGTGITTGLSKPRQGYQGTGDPADQNVQPNENNIVDRVRQQSEVIESLTPKYPYAASDFFMNLGSGILSQPGGQPIFQTIGKASGPAFQQLQKTKMGEYSNKRNTIMQIWQSLSKDEQDAYYKRAQMLMEQDPERFPDMKSALKQLFPTQSLYRKDQSPAETEREEIIRDEKTDNRRIEQIASTYKIGFSDAKILNEFMDDIDAGTYKVPHDSYQYYIEDDPAEILREGEKIVLRDYDPNQDDYKDGRVYIDFVTKKAYVKQGPEFIPYETYIAEDINTD